MTKFRAGLHLLAGAFSCAPELHAISHYYVLSHRRQTNEAGRPGLRLRLAGLVPHPHGLVKEAIGFFAGGGWQSERIPPAIRRRNAQMQTKCLDPDRGARFPVCQKDAILIWSIPV